MPCCAPLPAAREFLHIKITRSHAEHSHTFVHLHHNAASIFIVSLYRGAKEILSLTSQAARIARTGVSSGQLASSKDPYEQQFRSPPHHSPILYNCELALLLWTLLCHLISADQALNLTIGFEIARY